MKAMKEAAVFNIKPSLRGGTGPGASNLEELNCVLTSAVMIRRLKTDVLSQLPKKRRQQVHALHWPVCLSLPPSSATAQTREPAAL